MFCLIALGILVGSTSAAFAHGTEVERDLVLEQQLLLAPTDPELHLRRAEAWWRQGRAVEAEAALLTAETLGAMQRQTAPLKIRMRRAAGDRLQALALCDTALTTSADAELLRLRAELLTELDRHAEAAAAYESLLSTAAANPDDVLAAARALRSAGASGQAVRILDRAMARMGPLASLQQAAIEVEIEERRFDAAMARLDVLLARNPRHRAWQSRRRQLEAMMASSLTSAATREKF